MNATIVQAMGRALAGLEIATGRLLNGPGQGPPAHGARIAPYDGYGTTRAITAFGRVLRSAPPAPARAGAGMWENFISTCRRFGTDEIPWARVRVRVGGAEREVTANEEGIFTCRIELPQELPPSPRWHDVQYALVDPGRGRREARGRVYVPAATAAFGIISDIDDTVVRTDVGQWVRMVHTTVFGNARTRLPFPGVASFYSALSEGTGAAGPNPVFYVSSSPWNLRELLAEFLELRGIPAGPILLSDWGSDSTISSARRRRAHKLGMVREILTRYPGLPFILLGDSGQEDPEIYALVAREYPGRILTIYIRDVARSARRSEEIRSLAAELRPDCDLVLSCDTMALAHHAAARGWIGPMELAGIAANMGDG